MFHIFLSKIQDKKVNLKDVTLFLFVRRQVQRQRQPRSYQLVGALGMNGKNVRKRAEAEGKLEKETAINIWVKHVQVRDKSFQKKIIWGKIAGYSMLNLSGLFEIKAANDTEQ